ncbi:BlaI/MecI/CopY family transcriptional regulator [Georgenia halophila]|uniref:BlaI/MecI/CopY family transcriptional regulator n=1 Tax=Georgenia halophila TaxID=620889 RepID=A0ABP8LBF2_9MICO
MAMGNLESEVMAYLWDADGPCTVREVHEALTEGRRLAYTTVMTVMDRLAKKGVVNQEREGRAYRYSPAQTREQAVADLMLDALGATPDPSARAAALQHFVGRVGPGEAEAIREALADPDRAR